MKFYHHQQAARGGGAETAEGSGQHREGESGPSEVLSRHSLPAPGPSNRFPVPGATALGARGPVPMDVHSALLYHPPAADAFLSWLTLSCHLPAQTLPSNHLLSSSSAHDPRGSTQSIHSAQFSFTLLCIGLQS